MTDIKFDFNDIILVPAKITNISSRKDVNIYDENGMLRIFTAPMFDVVNEKNRKNYNDNKIYTIIPRKSKYTKEDVSAEFNNFIAYGLTDIKYLYLDNDMDIKDKHYALIDVANGHMKSLIDIVRELKVKYGDKLVLMVGNIANPETYRVFNDIGIEFIRVGIGGGSVCSTTVQTAVGYPMTSLLSEINEIKKEIGDYKTKVIADGGLHGYSDINVALGLGADYIMSGGIFSKSLESSGQCYTDEVLRENGNQLEQNKDGMTKLSCDIALDIYSKGGIIYKLYRGMSTKSVQRELKRDTIRTSEGITKYNKVEYTLSGWVENYIDYLTSTLSYLGYDDVTDFIGSAEYVFITQQAFNRTNK